MPIVDFDAAAMQAPSALLPSQRRQYILDFLHRHGAATLHQLGQAIPVSVSTLRRDLDSLAEEGAVDRTHGGAVLRHQQYSTFEPDSKAAAELSPDEKQRIGSVAAESLQAGQSVIFDSGSTVVEAARATVARGIPLVCITNDLQIAHILGASHAVQLHVFSGRLRPGSNTLLGEGVVAGTRALCADVLLMGVHAVSDAVLSETSPEVASVKRAFLQAAKCKRLLIDSSKFRPRAFVSVCDLAAVDEVITDSRLAQDERERVLGSGVKLTVVGAQA